MKRLILCKTTKKGKFKQPKVYTGAKSRTVGNGMLIALSFITL